MHQGVWSKLRNNRYKVESIVYCESTIDDSLLDDIYFHVYFVDCFEEFSCKSH